MFYDIQLKLIHHIQSSNFWIDSFFKGLNYFDSIYFYLFLIVFLWAFYNEKWGIRLTYLTFFTILLNNFLKNAFHQPRPYFLDPSVGKTFCSSYGLPSGGALMSMLFAILLIYFWRKKWVYYVAIGYVALISFSRVYLGIHFPTDILGGWVVGAFCAYVFLKLYPHLEAKIQNLSKMRIYWITQALGVAFYLTMSGDSGLGFAGATMGIGAGYYFASSFEEVVFFSLSQRCFSLLIAFLGTLILFVPLELFRKSFSLGGVALLNFTENYILGLWMIYLFPMIRKYLFKTLKI